MKNINKIYWLITILIVELIVSVSHANVEVDINLSVIHSFIEDYTYLKEVVPCDQEKPCFEILAASRVIQTEPVVINESNLQSGLVVSKNFGIQNASGGIFGNSDLNISFSENKSALSKQVQLFLKTKANIVNVKYPSGVKNYLPLESSYKFQMARAKGYVRVRYYLPLSAHALTLQREVDGLLGKSRTIGFSETLFPEAKERVMQSTVLFAHPGSVIEQTFDLDEIEVTNIDSLNSKIVINFMENQ